MIIDISYAILILLLVAASSFSMYFPLRVLAKDKLIALRYAIPFSVSIEIVLGYFFYATNTTKAFPISFLIFVILANIIALFRIKPTFIFPKINYKTLLISLASIFAILYTRYYDAFNFVGPGGNDTYNHILFIRDLLEKGYLHNGFYAPGFHLFLMPIAKVIPLFELYRFAGPAIGLIIILSFVLLVKDYLKDKISLVFLLSLLTLPVYNQFSLQTIYFFSSTLSFIYFAAIIFILSDYNTKQKKIIYYLSVLFLFALASTIPYFFVTLIPASLLTLLIILLWFRKKFEFNYLKHICVITVFLVFGLFISFGHVFLQSSVLKRYYGFPGIAVNQPAKTEKVDTETPPEQEDIKSDIVTNNELADKLPLPSFISNNSFLKPMIGAGYDITRMKFLRPANTILGFGAYAWILASIIILIYAVKKKSPTIIIVLTSFSVFFGLCTQTGLFELSSYQGRSGWYLMMLSILCMVLFVDKVLPKRFSRYVLCLSALFMLSGFFAPPTFNRSYDDEQFKAVRKLAKEYENQRLTLIANNYQISIVANNITALGMSPTSLQNDNSLLILENEMMYPEPKRDLIKENNLKITSEEKEFSKFGKDFENDRFTIYKNF